MRADAIRTTEGKLAEAQLAKARKESNLRDICSVGMSVQQLVKLEYQNKPLLTATGELVTVHYLEAEIYKWIPLALQDLFLKVVSHSHSQPTGKFTDESPFEGAEWRHKMEPTTKMIGSKASVFYACYYCTDKFTAQKSTNLTNLIKHLFRNHWPLFRTRIAEIKKAAAEGRLLDTAPPFPRGGILRYVNSTDPMMGILNL